MTELSQRISETPMAPYTDILLSMKPKEMLIVVNFLQEAMREATAENVSNTAADSIRKKYKSLTISPETKDLVRDLSLSTDEMADERTQYILGC